LLKSNQIIRQTLPLVNYPLLSCRRPAEDRYYSVNDTSYMLQYPNQINFNWQYVLVRYDGNETALYDNAGDDPKAGISVYFPLNENKNYNITSATYFTTVPIPTTALLFGSALLCLVGVRMRRKGA
jgi:hypothetical protein